MEARPIEDIKQIKIGAKPIGPSRGCKTSKGCQINHDKSWTNFSWNSKTTRGCKTTKTGGRPFLVGAIAPPKVTRPMKTKVGPFSISDKSATGSFVTK